MGVDFLKNNVYVFYVNKDSIARKLSTKEMSI